ncbi:MAG: bifunctional phosphoglucose/phosphomannose isomerase [Ignavibacteriales bacterium]|nr:bifunctional phosphoglucose/phosphomannose isomerase [Ignavibacteriales bacterium]MCF8306575.1 bifunctional phosphoglucose/phosphomannose isomerase [Ignavibacteriales bacterium]MCF8316374.1 bifunctional phosphoglucose/phosphomannose isomerase [Ignavibacteriales bacterium]MCF8437668.1 bifunctional phosphoglucose/phosphomannose isomerase [Ignavibacteriales bacterium]
MDFVEKYDPTGQYEVLKRSYEQIEFAGNIKSDHKTGTNKIDNIVLCGMGGSAIAGDLFRDLYSESLKVPVIVNRTYKLPDFSNADTLFIISSYSGNTEETLSCLSEIIDKGYSCICITTGGKVKELAEKNGFPCYILQTGFHPRYALYLSLFSLVSLMVYEGVIPDQADFIKNSAALLKTFSQKYSSHNSPALVLAEKLIGSIPVIYSYSGINESIGTRFRCQLNENSKMFGLSSALPEMNHNEIVAWESFGAGIPFKTIFLDVPDAGNRNALRRKITSEVISGAGSEIHSAFVTSTGHKEYLLEQVYFLDWVSYFLAVLQGRDPAEIDNINRLKAEMSAK